MPRRLHAYAEFLNPCFPGSLQFEPSAEKTRRAGRLRPTRRERPTEALSASPHANGAICLEHDPSGRARGHASDTPIGWNLVVLVQPALALAIAPVELGARSVGRRAAQLLVRNVELV